MYEAVDLSRYTISWSLEAVWLGVIYRRTALKFDYQGACEIPERSGNSKLISRGLEILQELW